MSRRRLATTLVGLVALLAACGEPAADVRVPARQPGQKVLDSAGILDDDSIVGVLDAHGAHDVVALTFVSSQAGLGEADRAGRELLDAWDADIALVAVAGEGAFREPPEQRERIFGLVAADAYDVPRAVRERIVEEIAPPIAAENRWTDLFVTAAEELRKGIG